VAENAREAIRISNQFVDEQIKNMVYVMNFVQFDEELQLAVQELERVVPSTPQGDVIALKRIISRRLDPVINSLGNLYLTVLLPNQQYFATYSTFQFDPAYFYQRSWFPQLQLVSGYNVLWVGAEPNYDLRLPDKPYLLTAAKPLRMNAVTYGYVVVSLEMSAIQNVFKTNKPNDIMTIVDRKGRVILDKNPAAIGTVFPFADRLPEDNNVSFVNVEGDEYILLAENITPEWKLVSMSPYKEASQKIKAFRQTDFAFQLLFLIVFAIIVLYGVRAITKPIARLVQTVERIERGQLHERSNISGEDEVGKLGIVFDRMVDRIERMIEENQREQEQKRKAELAMLQAQINPHFLFNVLNSIRLKILLRGDEDNAGLISSLASLLRMTINRNNEFIPLHEEIEVNKHYVRLLNSRHGDRVTLRLGAASDTLLFEVPRFILQPLIENAYIHGLQSKEGEIAILSHLCEDGRLQLEIQDSGSGMTEERMEQLRRKLEPDANPNDADEASPSLSGIGISNVFERLQLLYGSRFDYDLISVPGQGTSIVLRFPEKQRNSMPLNP
jgi:two-component system sensor histidine kinase YesM